jgi:hypothetical protein
MKQMILVKGMGAALAVAVMAGPASAGIREYCDSYARDVAHRKINGAFVGGPSDRGQSAGIGSVGGTILGAGVTGDRYKRAYTNAYERCVNNYEGQRVTTEPAENKAAETKVTETKVTETKATETKVTETKAAANKVTATKVAANEVAEKDEASGASWAKACARKYRSWDAQKGKYKSYSGKWKPCRL